MMYRITFSLLAMMALGQTSCFTTNYGEGGWSCNRGQCPTGYYCAHEGERNVCRLGVAPPPAVVDAALDVSLPDLVSSVEQGVTSVDIGRKDILRREAGRRDTGLKDILAPKEASPLVVDQRIDQPPTIVFKDSAVDN